MQALNDETGGKKDYISQLEWKSARTAFEIRTNMIKVACNYGNQGNNTRIVDALRVVGGVVVVRSRTSDSEVASSSPTRTVFE